MLLTIDEVATALRVSRDVVRRQWYSGEIPAPIRVGRRGIRWRETDIEQFLRDAAGLAGPVTEPEAKRESCTAD